ncbi:hypothetical protein ACWGFX_19215 [Streptomyces xanthophaeus]
MNAALPERTTQTEAIDGADLVQGERLYEPGYRNWLRAMKLGALLAYGPVEERYLRKHGVRTAAVRLQGRPDPYGYTDPCGLVRTVRHSVQTWSIEAAYDPRDPGRVHPLQSRGRRIRDAVPAVLTLGIGLLFAGGAVVMVVGALLGEFDSLI